MTESEQLLHSIKGQINAYFDSQNKPEPTPEPPAPQPEPEIPFTNFTVTADGKTRVICAWDAVGDGEIDVQYYRPAIEAEWAHSYANYRQMIDIRDESVVIEFSESPTWKFRAVYEGEGLDVHVIDFAVTEPPVIPEPEPKPELPKPEPVTERLPSSAEKDWNPALQIVSGRQFAGHDYTIAGVEDHPLGVMLAFQSKHSLPDSARTAGSVAFSKDLINWTAPKVNPVLRKTMNWQGTDSQGRAHRTGMSTMIVWDNEYLCYYRDRIGNYPGMRAMGVATSKDGTSWNQRDYPFLTVEDVKRIVPAKYFTGDPVFTHGRVYLNFVTVADGYVYAIIDTLVDGIARPNGKYETFLIRGKDPLHSKDWEFVETAWLTEGRKPSAIYKIGNKWLFLRGATKDGKRYITFQALNKISDRFDDDVLLPTNITNNPRGIYLYSRVGKYHIFFSDRNSPDNIHLISEK